MYCIASRPKRNLGLNSESASDFKRSSWQRKFFALYDVGFRASYTKEDVAVERGIQSFRSRVRVLSQIVSQNSRCVAKKTKLRSFYINNIYFLNV